MSNNRIDRTNKILKLEGISGEGLMRKSFSRINRVTSNINSKYKKEDDDNKGAGEIAKAKVKKRLIRNTVEDVGEAIARRAKFEENIIKPLKSDMNYHDNDQATAQISETKKRFKRKDGKDHLQMVSEGMTKAGKANEIMQERYKKDSEVRDIQSRV